MAEDTPKLLVIPYFLFTIVFLSMYALSPDGIQPNTNNDGNPVSE